LERPLPPVFWSLQHRVCLRVGRTVRDRPLWDGNTDSLLTALQLRKEPRQAPRTPPGGRLSDLVKGAANR